MILTLDGHTTADFVYQWKQDEYGKIQKAMGVSKELSSIRFKVAALNTRQETISLGPSTHTVALTLHEFSKLRK